jgi:hypothetical protein
VQGAPSALIVMRRKERPCSAPLPPLPCPLPPEPPTPWRNPRQGSLVGGGGHSKGGRAGGGALSLTQALSVAACLCRVRRMPSSCAADAAYGSPQCLTLSTAPALSGHPSAANSERKSEQKAAAARCSHAAQRLLPPLYSLFRTPVRGRLTCSPRVKYASPHFWQERETDPACHSLRHAKRRAVEDSGEPLVMPQAIRLTTGAASGHLHAYQTERTRDNLRLLWRGGVRKECCKDFSLSRTGTPAV